MIKTLNFTGSRSDCIRAIDEFLFTQVTQQKPTINHLIMVGEHCCSAMLSTVGNYSVVFSVDIEAMSVSFSASVA